MYLSKLLDVFVQIVKCICRWFEAKARQDALNQQTDNVRIMTIIIIKGLSLPC